MTGRLDNKIALVTGGESGLGKAIAQQLAVEGASVVIIDVQRDLGRATAEELSLIFYEQDVTHEAQWVPVIDQIVARHGLTAKPAAGERTLLHFGAFLIGLRGERRDVS